jgi:outer membrane murein-binding lipoprotein Lpp
VSQQINLFNPVFLKKNKLFSAVAMAQGLGLICAGLVGIGFLSGTRIGQMRQDAAEAASRLAAAQSQLSQMVERTKPTQKDASLEEAIKIAEGRLRGHQQILDFVRKGEFGNTHGYAEFFRALSRRTMTGVWLTGFSLEDGNGDMEIYGRALQPTLIPTYITTLRQEPLFRGKSFGSLELRTPQTGARGSAPIKGAYETPYVEFTLRSSDAVGDLTEHGEVKSK